MNRSITRVLVIASALFATLTLGIVACDVVDRSGSIPAAVARLDNEEIVLLAEPSNAETLLREGLERINSDVRFASFESEPEVVKIGPGYFLVGRGQDVDGRCVTIALDLHQEEDGSLGRLTENGTFERPPRGHTCTGVNCSGCTLGYQPGGGFYCDCWRPGGGEGGSWCNHSCTGDC